MMLAILIFSWAQFRYIGETLDDIQVEAFAVVREAARRTLGMRHFDVQVVLNL